MSVERRYKSLSERLISVYAQRLLSQAVEARKQKFPPPKSSKDADFIRKIVLVAATPANNRPALDLDAALDAIDLAQIYAGVDKREQSDSDLGYEDFVVLELLRYFKHDFFKWVTTPKCPNCTDSNVSATGRAPPPSPNPDQISVVEVYRCDQCRNEIRFPRINNPVKLLETKIGRCGEWVNCFLLVLKALLGSEASVRYVWNNEDHVWCEYYSSHLQRWIHLDPCEAVFDEPTLYCNNWGKRMSWVFGINESYIMDLSSKYIVPEKQIDQSSVADVELVAKVIRRVNQHKLTDYYAFVNTLGLNKDEKFIKLYEDVILMQNRERQAMETPAPSKTSSAPQGRQTGSAEWTSARGESG